MYSPGQTLGFEKEKLRCLVNWSEGSSEQTPKNSKREYFTVSCKQYSSEDEDTYQTFLPVLGTGTTKSFCVEKQNGNFARGVSSNAAWYAEKINNQWNVLWTGQDYPPCSKVSDFPVDFYTNCYDEQSKKIKNDS